MGRPSLPPACAFSLGPLSRLTTAVTTEHAGPTPSFIKDSGFWFPAFLRPVPSTDLLDDIIIHADGDLAGVLASQFLSALLPRPHAHSARATHPQVLPWVIITCNCSTPMGSILLSPSSTLQCSPHCCSFFLAPWSCAPFQSIHPALSWLPSHSECPVHQSVTFLPRLQMPRSLLFAHHVWPHPGPGGSRPHIALHLYPGSQALCGSPRGREQGGLASYGVLLPPRKPPRFPGQLLPAFHNYFKPSPLTRASKHPPTKRQQKS